MESHENIHCQDEDPQSILDYWTEERMQEAIPVPMPILSKEDLERLKEKPPPSGTVESVEGYNPTLDQLRGIPANADVNLYPFSTGGRLFFILPDGRKAKASAQFCGDLRILLTAAHCVRDHKTGLWFKNVMFHRAYNGAKDQGQRIPIKCMLTRSEWHNGNEPSPYNYDYSFLTTEVKSTGGYLGWKTNIPYERWTAIGYPSNYGGGEYMQKVDGRKGPDTGGGLVQMLDNPMGVGSSGGAWIGDLKKDKNNANWLIGLNSFEKKVNPQNTWSPLFDEKFVELYMEARELKQKALAC